MEALELYREETRKLEEHKYLCQSAEKEVESAISLLLSVYKLNLEVWEREEKLVLVSRSVSLLLLLILVLYFCSFLHPNPTPSWWPLGIFQ